MVDKPHMAQRLERAAGTLLTVNDRSDFDLGPICKLLKEAHDHIVDRAEENKRLAEFNRQYLERIASLEEHLSTAARAWERYYGNWHSPALRKEFREAMEQLLEKHDV